MKKPGAIKRLNKMDKRTIMTPVYLSPNERRIVNQAVAEANISIGELFRSGGLDNAKRIIAEKGTAA